MTVLLLELQLGTSPASNPMQWAVVAFAIVTILYVAVIRPMRKGKARRDPLERKPTQSSLAQQRAIERDMGNLLVQYEEMIRRMTAQVDIRAKKLEMLIQDAEERISQLKALIGSANLPPATGSASSPRAGSASSPQAGSTNSGQAGSGQTGDGNGGVNPAPVGEPGTPAGAASLQSPQDGAATATLEARNAADKSSPPGKVDDRHAEIYRLADGGRTAQQIAQELNRQDGEVELILRLRNPRPRQGDLWEQPTAAAPAEPMPGQAEAFNPPESPPGSGDPRRKGRKKLRPTGS